MIVRHLDAHPFLIALFSEHYNIPLPVAALAVYSNDDHSFVVANAEALSGNGLDAYYAALERF